MKRSRLARPHPATVIATAALFVALTGTGYAALKIPSNSVGAKQLKANAVTSAKVKNGSLKAADFASATLLKGATGAQGLQGPAGVPGTAGAAGPVHEYVKPVATAGLPFTVATVALPSSLLGVQLVEGVLPVVKAGMAWAFNT